MTELQKIVTRIFQILCLIMIDLLAFYASLFLAVFIRVQILPHLFPSLPFFLFSYSHFLAFWWIPVIFLAFISFEALYINKPPFWDEVRALVKSVSHASIILLAIVTLGLMSGIMSRIVLLGLWAMSLFLFPIFRLWGKKFLYAIGIWREKILIIGAGNAGKLVMEGFRREKHMSYDVVGFLDDDNEKIGKMITGKKIFGKVNDFPKFIHEFGIRTAIIAIPSLPPEQLSSLTARVQNIIPDTMVVPDLKGIALLNTNLFHLFLEEIFVMNIRNNLKSLSNRFVKRLFDLTVSIVFMPVILPLIGILGIIIRLETPGLAIYTHERIGENGRGFRCYKFRTMQKDAEEKLKGILENNEQLRSEWENSWKLKDDPRVTKIGSFLRRSSLDELPQIFNVLKGEMSLVGPRPYLPRERQDIQENIQIICSAKPGITGLWQVSGRSDTHYKYRVKLDAWYVMNWSLWLDIAIIFKTIRVVLQSKGAY